MLKRALYRIMDAEHEEARLHETFNRQVALSGLMRRRGGILVDVGALDGAYTQGLLDAIGRRAGDSPAWHPVIAEVSAVYLAKARQRYACVAVNAERSDLPFREDSVDCVVLNQILEHLKDPFRVLGEADRVLKVGGILLIGVPNLAGLVNRLFLLAGRQPPATHLTGPHVRGYAFGALRAYLESNGNFRIRRCFGSCLYPLWPGLSERLAVPFPGLSSYVFFILEKTGDIRPSPWFASRSATGETTFGDG